MQAMTLLLNWLNALLALVPGGTALYNDFVGKRTLIEQIIAEDRQPTDAEWTQLDLDTATKEALIDTLTAQRNGG